MPDRPTGEVHQITALGSPCPGANCTITFSDPLTVAFRQSGGAQFTGCIGASASGSTCSGTGLVLNVTAVASGTITVNAPITDWTGSVGGSTAIASQTSGAAGGVGVYALSSPSYGSGFSIASEPMAAAGYASSILYPSINYNQPVNFLTYAGLENLTVQRGQGNIFIQNCAYCWVKNVNSSWMAFGAIEVYASARVQIDTVYGHDCWSDQNAGAEYPFDFSAGATEIYMVNSISRACGKNMTAKGNSAANVIAYSYADDNFSAANTCCNYWVINSSLDGSHFNGAHHYLFEGNWAVNARNDETHGNSTYHNYFRNFLGGYRTPFTDNQVGVSVNDFTGTNEGAGLDFLMGGAPDDYSYWEAFVGNTLGTAGYSIASNGWGYQSPTGGFTANPYIWKT